MSGEKWHRRQHAVRGLLTPSAAVRRHARPASHDMLQWEVIDAKPWYPRARLRAYSPSGMLEFRIAAIHRYPLVDGQRRATIDYHLAWFNVDAGRRSYWAGSHWFPTLVEAQEAAKEWLARR